MPRFKNDISDFPALILEWYDQHRRQLPWRRDAADKAEPYHIWLSEIMLQQTTVPTVGPYFEKFLTKWPTVQHLALAPLDEVLTAWAGLGYYARARNLHKCAQAVWYDHKGKFPDTEGQLLELPGIGPYTAAAIAAIAFDLPAVVIDGNIERIICRLFRLEEVLPKGRPVIREHAASVTPDLRAGDYAQALMDIGSGICTPKKPDCDICPVGNLCQGRAAGDAETYPRKAPKKAKPSKSATVLWIENGAGAVLMRRREEKGLLGGMMEFPSTDWTEVTLLQNEQAAAVSSLLCELGLEAEHGLARPPVKHTFTHFHLSLTPLILQLVPTDMGVSNQYQWVNPSVFDEFALPTLMKKVAKAVASAQGDLKLD